MTSSTYRSRLIRDVVAIQCWWRHRFHWWRHQPSSRWSLFVCSSRLTSPKVIVCISGSALSRLWNLWVFENDSRIFFFFNSGHSKNYKWTTCFFFPPAESLLLHFEFLLTQNSNFNGTHLIVQLHKPYCYAKVAVSSPAVTETIASTHCTCPRRNGQAEWAWLAWEKDRDGRSP